MKKQKFRFFYIDKNKKQISVEYFECGNRSIALHLLRKYQKTHTDHKYYYSTAGGFLRKDENGVLKEYNHDEFFDFPKDEKNYFQNGKKEGIRETRNNVISVAKTGHLYGEWFSLDYHILEDLKYNLPILIKKHIGFPSFLPSDKECDRKESNKKWEEMLQNFLLDVRLYCYYRDFGIVDETIKSERIFHKKYKNTIPYYEGTYNDINYKKLYKLTKKHWNKIWDFMKKYGESLWD